MRTARILVAIVAVLALAGLALAGGEGKTVTVTGKLLCAKCTAKKADAKECQSIIVASENGKDVEYYLAKNAAATEFGHVCKGEKAVTATGVVTMKDGKTWIEATKIEQPKS
jgi:hypothetical protein